MLFKEFHVYLVRNGRLTERAAGNYASRVKRVQLILDVDFAESLSALAPF